MELVNSTTILKKWKEKGKKIFQFLWGKGVRCIMYFRNMSENWASKKFAFVMFMLFFLSDEGTPCHILKKAGELSKPGFQSDLCY